MRIVPVFVLEEKPGTRARSIIIFIKAVHQYERFLKILTKPQGKMEDRRTKSEYQWALSKTIFNPSSLQKSQMHL
jgi:hypothetical protein